MLAHRIPYPPHTGDKTRAYHVARYLARRHDLTLACLVDERADLPGVGSLREAVRDIEFARLWKPWSALKGLAGLATGSSLTLPYFASRGLHARLARRLASNKYDVVYASSSAMAQYVEGVDLPLVMDFVDVDSDKWSQYAQHTRPPRSWLYRAEGRRLQACEAEIAETARICLLATAAEEAMLKSFAPGAHTAVIPNGIDVAYYAPMTGEPAQATLLFTGAMDYLPNIDAVCYFCADILPLVRRQIPETRLYIVGLHPAPEVRRLANTPGVFVTGAVPDVRPYYARATVCIAPLRIGRGVQNKVLQAMAMGLPVVASGVAHRGIEAEPGKHLYVEDDPAAFASRLIHLLRSPEERRTLGRQARAFVEAHHAWESSLARMEALVTDLVHRPSSSGVPAPDARATALPGGSQPGLSPASEVSRP